MTLQPSITAAPGSVEVGENNHPQTADAGEDQIAQAGGTVTLDGTPSSDPYDDKLTYKWT
jgi:hypothetical protein